MKYCMNKAKVLLLTGVFVMAGSTAALASDSFVNSGPGVAMENQQGNDNPEAEQVVDPAAPYTGEDGNTYKNVDFPWVDVTYRLGNGSQLTNVVLTLKNVPGNVTYDACVNNGGWQPWTFNGQPTGGMESSTYLEGIRIMPRAGLELKYDVYYSCTMSGLGKLGYAKNGELSGAPGRGEHVIDIDIVFVEKGGQAPDAGTNLTPFISAYADRIGMSEDGRLVYQDENFTNGWLEQSGLRWYVRDGEVLRGWQYIDGFKYYFDEGGQLIQDVDALIGKQSSYQLKINKLMNCLTVYAKDGDSGYIIPVKSMITSVGDDTPIGTFKTPEKFRWRLMVTGAYAQYATRIKPNTGFLLHSVIYDIQDNQTLWTDTFNGIGVLRSLGCVRLHTGDAKWIYDNCAVGTSITVYDDENPGPFVKPGTIPIPQGQTYDPTDPDVVHKDTVGQVGVQNEEQQS